MNLPRPDIHTHDHNRHATAIINISPGDTIEPQRYYSVSIHPWDAHTATDIDIDRLNCLARHPQIILIGETGLDSRRGDLQAQAHLLRHHINLSETLGKPLLLHIVGQYNQIIALRRQLHPAQPWIIHGFRGKPQLAQQLINNGFFISLGEKFNPFAAAIIPPDKLLFESDTSSLPIDTIISRIKNSADGVAETK